MNQTEKVEIKIYGNCLAEIPTVFKNNPNLDYRKNVFNFYEGWSIHHGVASYWQKTNVPESPSLCFSSQSSGRNAQMIGIKRRPQAVSHFFQLIKNHRQENPFLWFRLTED